MGEFNKTQSKVAKLLFFGGILSGAANGVIWLLRYPPYIPVTPDSVQTFFGLVQFFMVVGGGLLQFDNFANS